MPSSDNERRACGSRNVRTARSTGAACLTQGSSDPGRVQDDRPRRGSRERGDVASSGDIVPPRRRASTMRDSTPLAADAPVRRDTFFRRAASGAADRATSVGEPVVAPFGFDEAFAKVQQVAARLDLARAPEIGRVHGQAGEGIGTGDHARDRPGWRRTRTGRRRASGRTRRPRAGAASPGRGCATRRPARHSSEGLRR